MKYNYNTIWHRAFERALVFRRCGGRDNVEKADREADKAVERAVLRRLGLKRPEAPRET